MRAVVYETHGGPDVLDYREVPDPAPADGQVLVHVEAAVSTSATSTSARAANTPCSRPRSSASRVRAPSPGPASAWPGWAFLTATRNGWRPIRIGSSRFPTTWSLTWPRQPSCRG